MTFYEWDHVISNSAPRYHSNIKHSNFRVKHSSCNEGPRHDPYSVDTWSVHRNGHSYILRLGSLSGISLKIDGETVWNIGSFLPSPITGDEWDRFLVRLFERFVGMSLTKLQKYYHERIYVEDPMGCLADYE